MISPDNNSDAELTALKNQMFTLLVALIVVSGTLTVYLYRQVSLTNKGIIQSRQMTANITTNEMAVGNFVGQLVNYGERHPDFVPVLKKYGLVPGPGAAPAGSPVQPKK